MATKKKFLVLDGNALLHRAWHALPQTMTTADGTIVNAAYGFTMIVERMLDDMNPDYMAVAWDLPGTTFRHEEFEDYKGTREKKEQELYDQIEVIQDILDVYGIPSLSAEAMEADDVIGTIAERNRKNKNVETRILTGDLDALQLVDPSTKVVFFVKGISETKVYDESAVKERFELAPEQVIDLKALMGDSSDNIPGVAGVGKKTATELLKQFDSVEGIFKALTKDPDAIKPAWRKKLEGQEAHALKMKHLVTIVRDADLGDFRITDATVDQRNPTALVEKFRELEFRTLLKKYNAATEDKQPTGKKPDHVLLGAITDLNTKVLSVAVEVQAEDLFGGTIKSVAVSDGKKTYEKTHPSEKDLHLVRETLAKANQVIGHDIKDALHVLDLELESQLFDTMVAAYLLNSAGRGYEFPIVVQNELNTKLGANTGTALQATLVHKLYKTLKKRLEQEDLLKLATDIEMPLIPVLYQMELNGVKLDTGFLSTLSKKLRTELEKLTTQIHKDAGAQFNINSPSQLADVLFEKLELPTKKIKKTKTGFSTAASELEKLEGSHAIIPKIMKYRELAKLTSTYIDALPELVADDGRIHTTFNQTIAATGRLSSTDPNLQNIPIRTEQGREIRKAFVAERGNTLIAADYSQIELRIAATIAKDQPFISAFKEGADIHTRTAAEVFGLDEAKVTKDQRRAAKAVNFGILYGMGPRNLAKSTGLSIDEAKAFIDTYFQIHHAIQTFIDETKVKAHEEEVAETLLGRKRYFPEINSGVQMLVAQAERMAVNMPTQGTQADIIKLAMIEVDAWIRSEKKLRTNVKLLLQVHDELVLEVPNDMVDLVAKTLKQKMESVMKLAVPLVADVNVGKNWGSMKEWEG